MYLRREYAYVFLPVNVQAEGHKLAVVDREFADTHKELYRRVWRTSKTGVVYRRYTDRQKRDEKGRPYRVSEQLCHIVAGHAPFSPTFFHNNDPLDCRAENVKLAGNIVEARLFTRDYKPGSVLASLAGYNEALNELRTYATFYQHQLERTRGTKLENQQVLALLNECLTGVLKAQTAAAVAEWAEDELQVRLHPGQIRLLLNGTQQRQVGFDYAALAATRKNPRERALERWKDRQN